MLKSFGKLAVLTIVPILLFAGSAFAENRTGATTLTPMVGYNLIDGGLDVDSGASYGFALGYNITKQWGIEFDVRFTPTDYDKGGLSADIDVWTFGMSGLYHFQPEQVLNPYLAAGIGGVVYDVDGADSNDEDFMGYWGGGFKYAMSDNAALRLDLRHILDARTDSSGDSHDGSNVRHHLSAMLGVTFQFGGY